MDVAEAIRFYSRQDEWASIYQGDVQDRHQDNAALIRGLARKDEGRLLELGCGGGQNAAAAVQAGFTVVALDIVPSVLENARRLASGFAEGQLVVLEGDFHTVDVPGPFDVVCCWDGFGVGSDRDQMRLLARVERWLAPADSCALIDIFTPWYWKSVAGREQAFGRICRRYGFDPERQRMTDRWWPKDDESRAVTQSLRCYSPDELRVLAREVGLELVEVRPRGAFDHDEGVYHEQVELDRSMQYVARLVRV